MTYSDKKPERTKSMTVLSNCHTHTQFCDGRSTAEDMVLSALDKGFVSLGFSTHAPQLFDESYCVLPAREEEYRQEILRLREKYQGQIRIYLGIERDLFSCADPARYDYYLASVHYLPTLHGYVTVDGTADMVAASIRNVYAGSGFAFAKQYFELLAGYAKAWRPPIIGHFDLFRKNNGKLHFVDEDSTAYQDMAVQALHTIRESGAMLEVNTGAIARGYMDGQYPNDFALRAWRQMGGEVIVSSDCHDAKDLNCAFDRMPRLLDSLGYDHVVRLGQDALFERVPL